MADGQKKAPIGKTKALFDFQAENDGELSFKTDDIIWVLDKDDVGEWDGWWEGRCERTQQEGFFPADGWVEELPFTAGEGGSVITKPALPTAPKPPVKGRLSGHVTTGVSGESVGSVIASPSSPPQTPSENGSKKQETPITTAATPTTPTTTPTATPDDNDNSNNTNKREKENKDKRKEKPASKEEKPKEKEKEKEKPPKKEKPKPKRKAPRKGKEVELGDPYGFRKVGGFERRGGQAPEEQIAKLYNQSTEALVAMLEPHENQSDTKEVASPASPAAKDKAAEVEKKQAAKRAAKEEKKKADEEKKKAEEERKKKEKEERKKAKEEKKKNSEKEGIKRKGSQKNLKQSTKNLKDGSDVKDDTSKDNKDKEKPPAPEKKPSSKELKEEVVPPPSRIVKPSPPTNSIPPVPASAGPVPPPKVSPRPLLASTGDPLLDFLTTLKLESLHSTFKNEEMVFPDDFIGISHEELISLNIKMGPRRRIILAMQQYQTDGRIDPPDLTASQAGTLDGGEVVKEVPVQTVSSDNSGGGGKGREKEDDRKGKGKDTLDRRGGSNSQDSPHHGDEEGSSKISLPLKAEREINKLIEKSIKKEEGWVFPEDAAEEGATMVAKNEDEPEKKENESGDHSDRDSSNARNNEASVPSPPASAEEPSKIEDAPKSGAEQVPQEFHTLAELTSKNLPPDVDPAKLESHLSPKDFQDTFGMTKEAFYACPEWRRRKLKQEKNLF